VPLTTTTIAFVVKNVTLSTTILSGLNFLDDGGFVKML